MKIFNILFKVALLIVVTFSTYFYVLINRYTYGTLANTQTKTDRLSGDVYYLKFENGISGGGVWTKIVSGD